MNSYHLSHIANLLGLSPTEHHDPVIDVLLTDSRSLVFPERTLFFALVTAKGNGHAYINELYLRGVRAFVVSQPIPTHNYPEAVFLHVPNTLQALQLLARKHRERLTIPVVGITGSNGKTTLKEILYQLLRSGMQVARSPKSYNSAIGVPLSIWGIPANADIALIEAGISQPNEMDTLQQIIQPTLGIITNIGEAHQENFSSLEQKCLEKLRLFKGCSTIVCCLDDPLVVQTLQSTGLIHKTIGWSRYNRGAAVFVEHISQPKSGGSNIAVIIEGKRFNYHIPYTDDGTLHNTLLALTALLYIAPSFLENPQLLSHIEPISMRLEVIEGTDNMLLVNDTYNSDYESLRIALDFLLRRNTDQRPLALILSDIQESGIPPAELYKRVLGLVARYPINQLFFVGEELYHYPGAQKANGVYHNAEELLQKLPRESLKGHLVLIKGSRSARFEKVVHALEKRTHQTILDVNLSNIVHNLNYYRTLLPQNTKVVCMIKAFGYGAGSYEIAKTLTDCHCDYLAVALVDEGIALRERGISLPIIVMNPEASTFAHLIEYQLQPEIYSLSMLQMFVAMADSQSEHAYPIHLKWDTGMHRLGLNPKEINEVCNILAKTNAVRVASVFTHLAAADDPAQDNFTHQQLKLLQNIHTQLTAQLSYPFFSHALNTAGIMRFPQYAMDMVRLGIGLYGISPYPISGYPLKPVAGLRTVVLQVRDVPAGDTIGYGRNGKAEHNSRIAVIPIGYADGISRQLGQGAISFRTPAGNLVPTIGNICMDTLMLDVTNAPDVTEGAEITIFDETLPIERLAKACHTIPYEILANLSPRIARCYFSE